MMSNKKLSNEQVYEHLHAAHLALGEEAGETVLGDTALETARKALIALQVSIVQAEPKEPTETESQKHSS